jgi:hypothetical protein
MVMCGQEIKQRGVDNALGNGARRLKLTVPMGPGFGEEVREEEGKDTGT